MTRRLHALAVALLALPAAAWSQASAPAAQSQPSIGIEPRVQNIVIEDDNARIEELRVRGQTQSISVQPKGGAKRYEILPATQGRDMSDSAGSQRGAAGKRVWTVLSF